MKRKHCRQRIVLFFLILFTSTLIAATLAVAKNVYSDEELFAWFEIGDDSASGAGISVDGNDMVIHSLAVLPDGTPIIAWEDRSSGLWKIYVRRWNGTSWVQIGSGSASGKGVSISRGSSYHPSLAVGTDNSPIVAWSGSSNRSSEIYVRRLNGTSWEEIGDGSATGGGISKSKEGSITPSAAIGPDENPIIAWGDFSGSRSQIYVRRWDGTSWAEIGSGSASGEGISSSPGYSQYPSLAVDNNGTPIVAWGDSSDGDWEIYVRRWDGASWAEMGSASASNGGISNNRGDSEYPSLAIGPDGTPIIAWADHSGGKWQIYLRRWDGTSWVEMGENSASKRGISKSARLADFPFLAILPDGTPVVSWIDVARGSAEIYLRRYDGMTWVEMGNSSAFAGGVSDDSGQSLNPCLAIKPDGNPMVSWLDDSDGEFKIYTRHWRAAVLPRAAFLGSPTEGAMPQNVRFTNMSTGDFEKCLWDFGDGRTRNTCDDPVIAFKRGGKHTVSLTVDGRGGKDTVMKRDYLTVYEPPTADFSASLKSGAPPLEVEFRNLSTGDFDSCTWDFGDGRTSNRCGNHTRTFRHSGKYSVSLKVEGAGGTDTMVKRGYIMVAVPPAADFSASPTKGVPPLEVIFTNLSTGDIDTCLWDFGDGRTSSSCGSLRRTFRNEGEYTVSLDVKGPDGEDSKLVNQYLKVAIYRVFIPDIMSKSPAK